MESITSEEYGVTKEGKGVKKYVLKNSKGMSVNILDYGATIQSIMFPDRGGKLIDVTLGYDDLKSYEDGSSFFGGIVGRFANRIGGARFKLDGIEYKLDANSEEGHNHVHGVFNKRLFNAALEGGSLVLKYVSPDMEEGYPGELSVTVKYSVTEDDALEIDYTATTDKPTVINLSNHCYFNFHGNDGSTILDHRVKLFSSAFTECDEFFAQTGRIIPVDGTPLDFREEHTFGERFDSDYPRFRVCTGYDHNMILDGLDGELKPIGKAWCDKTGIGLSAFTTEPAIQFYSGNFIQYDAAPHGKNGIRYPKNAGFCFEAQHYPDSVNHENFPSTVLRPGEVYRQKTVYSFFNF